MPAPASLANATGPLALTKLTALMARTSGRREVKVGLIDGPVLFRHPDLVSEGLIELKGPTAGACARSNSAQCLHGTFVAGMLSGRRDSLAPAICPGCTLLIRPIFTEPGVGGEGVPSATSDDLAVAIVDCIRAGVRVINLSLALLRPSRSGDRILEESLNHALDQGVLVVAAAGNQGTVGSSALTRHPWVIPVAACDQQGRPMRASNLSHSIGRRGLSAPGDAITSLGAEGGALRLGGTSVSVPFVTGTAALLWSEFPHATAAQVKQAMTHALDVRRASLIPPLLDADASHRILKTGLRSRCS